MLVNGNRRVRRGLAIAFATAAIAAGSTAALAQTTTTPPYPGNPTTTAVPAETSATINLGARGLGSRFTVSQCGFKENTPVTFTVNNESVPGDTADSSTCVQETFEIQNGLVALRGARVGNMLAVTGLAQTARNVVVVVNGKAIEVGPLGSVVTSIARGTGVNGAARTVTVSFTVLRANQVDGSGGLARTGSAILKWSPLGVGLVAVGYMLVLVTRRRRTATA